MVYKSGVKHPFQVEQYSPDALTVALSATVPEHLRTVVDIRALIGRGVPVLPPSPFQPEILRLLELGFDYIDIGTHSDWVAAEIPTHKTFTEQQYLAAGSLLVSMRDKIDSFTGKKKRS